MELECSSCSSYGNISILKEKSIWRWELEIPYDWKYGHWERIRLYPAQVKTFFAQCDICGEESRIYPSFVVPGTTLTFSALVFTSFVYETSKLTWREIPEKFCTEENRIAHSTIYKAVHGLGKSVLVQEEKIREGIRKLKEALSPQDTDGLAKPLYTKALHEHTQLREASLHQLLMPLACFCMKEPLFPRAFYTYLRLLRLFSSALDPPIWKIYENA